MVRNISNNNNKKHTLYNRLSNLRGFRDPEPSFLFNYRELIHLITTIGGLNMTNLYSERIFTHTTTDGTDYRFYCYCQSTRTGFRHLCYDHALTIARREGFYYDSDYLAKQGWGNRTWERWTYETVLIKAIKIASNNNTQHYYELIKALIDGETIQEKKLIKQELEDFVTEFQKLPESAKQALQNSKLQLEDPKQAKMLLNMMQFINTCSMV